MASPVFTIELKADGPLHSVLVRIADALDIITQTKEPVCDIQPEVCSDEPTELSVDVPPELAEEPYGHIVYAKDIKQPAWNTVSRSKCAQWRVDGSKLLLKYRNEQLATDWDYIEYLSKLSQKDRSDSIRRKLGSKWRSNQFSAYNIIAECYKQCEIHKPEAPEKDLDAYFDTSPEKDADLKPMVTPYISTRPDPNCGGIEGTLEVR